ncbi:MAG: NUDIX domain-containing protein [Desulfobacteraceae bacterium]|nr:MAG: NUDIX domain-containing protein [Desulfobacteraceae bacterium]
MPGGWADINDSPSEAVVREVFEESGYRAKAVKLAAVYDRNRHPHPPMFYHVYKLFFICEMVGGQAAFSHETDGVDFFIFQSSERPIDSFSVSRRRNRLVCGVGRRWNRSSKAED